MATVRIREYRSLGSVPARGDFAPAQIPYEGDSTVDQTAITLSGTSQQSAAFNDKTNYIGISCDSANFCYVVGDDPTALGTNSFALFAGQIYYMQVKPGQKIAVIQAS